MQETADLVTFTEEILIEKLYFLYSVLSPHCLIGSVLRKVQMYMVTLILIIQVWHCVKIFHIWSYSGQYFPAFGLNVDRYEVTLERDYQSRLSH